MMVYLKIFFLIVLQNASFTLMSRARNRDSLMFHGLASILSNGVWLLVIRQVVINLDNPAFQVTYLLGAVVGSVLMHYISMHHIEGKDLWKKLKAKL